MACEHNFEVNSDRQVSGGYRRVTWTCRKCRAMRWDEFRADDNTPIIPQPPSSIARVAVLSLAILLAGCEDREIARKRNEDRLPAGCRIIDMDYGELRAAIVCEGRKTTTSLRVWTETIMVYDPNLKMMMPQTIYHSNITAEISSVM